MNGFHPILTRGNRMGYRNWGVKDSAGFNTKENGMNGYEMMAEFERVIRDVIAVHNDYLPESFRDNRTDSVTLADLERKCDSLCETDTDHQIEKMEKEKRIVLYAQQIANGQEITYLPK